MIRKPPSHGACSVSLVAFFKGGGLDRGADDLQRQQGQARGEGCRRLQQEAPPLLRPKVRRSTDRSQSVKIDRPIDRAVCVLLWMFRRRSACSPLASCRRVRAAAAREEHSLSVCLPLPLLLLPVFCWSAPPNTRSCVLLFLMACTRATDNVFFFFPLFVARPLSQEKKHSTFFNLGVGSCDVWCRFCLSASRDSCRPRRTSSRPSTSTSPPRTGTRTSPPSSRRWLRG